LFIKISWSVYIKFFIIQLNRINFRLNIESKERNVMTELEMMTDKEVDEDIARLKRKFGSDLVIPVHHYQRDEIARFADYLGDSLELSRVSAGTEAQFIVFCGVYFMAEIARIIASPEKSVFIPVETAGCPLANMAFIEDVEEVWERLQHIKKGGFIPVTYANSHAGLKAFCGKNGGFVCTSSNAFRVFQWIIEQGKRVFFMPDKNLGINTACSMGLGNDYFVVDRYSFDDEMEIPDKKLYIWNGYCIVHKQFTVEQIQFWRNKDSEIKIIVHPECDPEVVEESDYSGSTSMIKKMVEESSPGSKWVIGTEYNFVARLKRENPDKFIEPLEKSICAGMSKNRRRDLLRVLLDIDRGNFSVQITLRENISSDARKAIKRMLDLR